MRVRALLTLVAGFAVALAMASFPASASDASIKAQGISWNPNTASIQVGEKVVFTNPDGGMHNVHFDDQADALNAISTDNWTAERTFTTAGTYTFRCDYHGSAMSGTVTVGGSSTGTGTGTGTSTTPPPDTMPTDTITVPTNTETFPASTDSTAPSFVGKPKRRASRRSLILELRSSDDATLHATVFRRPPRGRSFTRISEASLQVKQGKNVVTLPRKGRALRSGAYRVKLQLVDLAGNKSRAATVTFKLA